MRVLHPEDPVDKPENVPLGEEVPIAEEDVSIIRWNFDPGTFAGGTEFVPNVVRDMSSHIGNNKSILMVMAHSRVWW